MRRGEGGGAARDGPLWTQSGGLCGPCSPCFISGQSIGACASLAPHERAYLSPRQGPIKAPPLRNAACAFRVVSFLRLMPIWHPFLRVSIKGECGRCCLVV